MTPVVSFVVPCYRLAHLLPECIESILGQTYGDFEVLVMDDCSPDNTPEVVQSFRDSRVKHVRNDPNLGHLRNYNRGIGLACGKYIWLISADDYLSRTYVLERYVTLLDGHPRVGYTFCPGVGVGSTANTIIGRWVLNGQSVHGTSDRIFKGHLFLKKLLQGNTIVAASGLVRRECYEKAGSFPLDMPWAGDWYLWCLFALRFDVGYFAEPMVCYREHELSMTNKLWKEDVVACCQEDVAIPWAIKRKADEAGFGNVSRDCLSALSQIYLTSIASNRYDMSRPALNLEEFENSLSKNASNEIERNFVRARVYAAIADQYYWRGELPSAKQFYLAGFQKDPRMVKVFAKWFLIALGTPGGYLRKSLGRFRFTASSITWWCSLENKRRTTNTFTK
jgi:glycosyltransferase involved in cell wall biosynthesis